MVLLVERASAVLAEAPSELLGAGSELVMFARSVDVLFESVHLKESVRKLGY